MVCLCPAPSRAQSQWGPRMDDREKLSALRGDWDVRTLASSRASMKSTAKMPCSTIRNQANASGDGAKSTKVASCSRARNALPRGESSGWRSLDYRVCPDL